MIMINIIVDHLSENKNSTNVVLSGYVYTAVYLFDTKSAIVTICKQ